MTHDEVRLLHEVHRELCEFRAESREGRIQHKELLDDHHLTLYGDGNGSPGLRMRTDRLEQKHHALAEAVEQKSKNRDMHLWTIWAAVVTSIGAAIASWFAPRP